MDKQTDQTDRRPVCGWPCQNDVLQAFYQKLTLTTFSNGCPSLHSSGPLFYCVGTKYWSCALFGRGYRFYGLSGQKCWSCGPRYWICAPFCWSLDPLYCSDGPCCCFCGLMYWPDPGGLWCCCGPGAALKRTGLS